MAHTASQVVPSSSSKLLFSKIVDRNVLGCKKNPEISIQIIKSQGRTVVCEGFL